MAHDLEPGNAADLLAAVDDPRFREAVDALPVLIAFIGADLRYRFNNRTYEQWFGIPRDQLVGKHLREVLGDEAFEAFVPTLQRVLAGEEQTVERTVVYRGAGERSVQIMYRPQRDGGTGEVVGFFALVQDVTDRVRQERTLRFLVDLNHRTQPLTDPEEIMAVTTRLLGEHLKASRCAYADVEPDGDRFTIRHDYCAHDCATTAGDYRLDLFGSRVAARQRSGRTLVIQDVGAELSPEEGRETFRAIDVAAIICCPLVKDGRLVAMMAVHQKTPRGWRQDEIELVEAVVERSWAYVERARVERRLRDNEARLERRVRERTEQLQRLAHEMTRVEARERRRIAHLLHDDLQQLLVAGKMYLEIFTGRGADEKQREPVRRAMEVMTQAVELSRSLSRDLSPPLLYDQGLIATLEWLAREYGERHGLSVVFHADADAEPESEDERLFLYQATRELLLNVAKHAGTREAELSLTVETGADGRRERRLVVRDRGSGATGEVRAGFGLFHIRHRAELLGGRFTFGAAGDSGEGGGVQVQIALPVAAQAP